MLLHFGLGLKSGNEKRRKVYKDVVCVLIMANKKEVKQGQEINLNLSDLVRVGMKLMPQLIPIAKEIANEMSIGGDSVELFKEKKVSKPKRKVVSKKRVPKVHKDHKGKYLCNQAVKPTKERLSRTWDKVDCQKCLAQRK